MQLSLSVFHSLLQLIIPSCITKFSDDTVFKFYKNPSNDKTMRTCGPKFPIYHRVFELVHVFTLHNQFFFLFPPPVPVERVLRAGFNSLQWVCRRTQLLRFYMGGNWGKKNFPFLKRKRHGIEQNLKINLVEQKTNCKSGPRSRKVRGAF